jgi:hypothetical protein
LNLAVFSQQVLYVFANSNLGVYNSLLQSTNKSKIFKTKILHFDRNKQFKLFIIKQALYVNQIGFPVPIRMIVCLQNVRLPIVVTQNAVAAMSLCFYSTGLGRKKEHFRYFLKHPISQNYISFYSNKWFFKYKKL